MKILFRTIFTIAIISIVLESCKRKREEAVTLAELDSIKMVYTALNDSLENAWTVMIEDDDEKLDYLRRLLKEVYYTDNYKEEEYDSLVNMVDALANMRYTQKSMARSELIDQYDSASFEIVRRVINYAQDHPEFENYPLMEQLVDSIQHAQNMVLIYRSRYDTFAKRVNTFVEKNEHRLIENDATTTRYKKYPLFELPSAPYDSTRAY